MIGRLLALTALAIGVEACSPPDGGQNGVPPSVPIGTAVPRAPDAERAGRAQAAAPCEGPECPSTGDVSATAAEVDSSHVVHGHRAPPLGPVPLGSVPATWVDSGTCPEGCWKGGEWQSLKRVQLRARPDVTSGAVAMLDSNGLATPIRWETHSVPKPFVVTRAGSWEAIQGGATIRVAHAAGDTIWALTYPGEGYFKVMLATGTLVDLNLGVDSRARLTAEQCRASPKCRGYLTEEIPMTHWMFLRTADRREGWTNEQSAFLIPD